MSPENTFILFTNRNCMVFDKNGEQIVEYQKLVSCYHRASAKRVNEMLDTCVKFQFSDFRNFLHDVTKKEIQYLLGTRTKKMDLDEIHDQRQKNNH